MLIVSGTSRAENRKDLARQCCQPEVPLRLTTQRSRLALESLLWREYWQPCRAFFEVDLRLVQRLNRLKKAWRNVLQHPADRLCQMAYCWRYFGLPDTAAVFCRGDGFRTEANHFVVTSPEWARRLRGERLW
jgi:hypothetical protein